MPVEFLTDEQAAAYAAYRGAPSRTALERFFFLDDADRELIESKRRAHNRLGFAAQLTTARYLGVFLDDPADVPPEVVDYLAEQLDIEDPSVLKAYGERENTRLEHVRELRQVLEYREFAEAEAELREWVDARAWTTGEGPKALFDAAVGWLRERRVLLPGVTTLTRLVASVREAANQRLWDTLYGMLGVGQRAVLDSLLTVPPGERVSELDRLRRGPVRVSGPQMKRALERVEEIAALGMGAVDVSGIPPRRLAELSRYGVDGKASLLRRHSDARRLATLLATTVYLTARAVDDALDLLEVLIATKLLARAERESAKEKLKTLPRVERASAKLATAFQVVFDTTSEQVDTDTGEIAPPKVESLEGMWAAIEQVVPRHELAAAIAALFELTPPLDSDADEAWRAMLVGRFGTVRPFLKLLVTVVDFDATPEGEPVLAALLSLPELMGRKKVGTAEIDTTLLGGSWRRLVLSAPHLEPGTVDWKAYTFCVLEQLHRMLRSKQVFARNSSKWGDPRAKLLAGEAWQQARPTVLASLNLPGEAGAHLAARAALLDGTYREVSARVPDNAQIVFDDGRLHFAALEPEPEPASLLDLRAAVNAMLPRVDLPEVLLEVMSWTGADQAFTSVTGGEARLKDLHVTIAALLVAHGCNVGYTPVMGGADPLKYGRLSHVDQTYLRLATYRAANAALIEHQASIALAQAWGGGLVASVDGMRFVVPVPSVYARPNPKYFGRRGGATWLNMINDQAAGLGGKVVAGTPRDSLYVLDVLYDRDGGRRPEMIVTDTASYSDIVFGLLTLAGFAYAPQLADLPDQKMWRIDRTADYGAFQDAARGRIDLARIERHWEDILRIICSIHTGAVRAYDVIRMLSRDGRPTPLGDAIAHYGRIAKTLHILRLADEPGYRRQIKVQANLQEGRHALARKIFHGRAGQLYQRYQDGMEDQIGALGYVLNALVLFNTRYMDAAVTQLRADGFDVRDEDVARLSPFVRHHVNVLGRYSFQLPDLPGGLRPLRDKHATDDE
ncbi:MULTISPECIES: Tn3 family transposase [Streptomyces]|uniref:Tn3 family transposase n=1 Tax=Streptomyces TaxID=1883 RepID=UPI0001AEE14F|nr:Tn3 family transposase [Streptomyces albidoflavus]MYX49932.1 Tn3 family transposase [Streptomyces sp. SID8385]BDH49032.1 DDE transposase [Streptomyces albus]AGI86439.1 Transposase for transposon Tn3 family [Streptomyces albidoflavus]QLP90210.1 Transposase for transposon Tn3 family [Streptomyces albidoflavus]WAE08724.1 Transposase for transposon Tn3 family [Streptomyces albidoflavus]